MVRGHCFKSIWRIKIQWTLFKRLSSTCPHSCHSANYNIYWPDCSWRHSSSVKRWVAGVTIAPPLRWSGAARPGPSIVPGRTQHSVQSVVFRHSVTGSFQWINHGLDSQQTSSCTEVSLVHECSVQRTRRKQISWFVSTQSTQPWYSSQSSQFSVSRPPAGVELLAVAAQFTVRPRRGRPDGESSLSGPLQQPQPSGLVRPPDTTATLPSPVYPASKT